MRRDSRAFPVLALAALAVLVRLPFLLVGDRFFDSDEAVEGLMARHVLGGELPVYMWGQQYKGVPEVYLMAATFAFVGPGVVALKAVTLGLFALFVCTQFVLVDTLIARRVAWLSSAFVLAAPPALVHWSLSGSAELVIIMLTGAVVWLGWHHWRETRSTRWLLVAAFAAGAGLWVQQFIIYYLAAIACVEMLRLPRPVAWWRAFFTAHSSSTAARGVVRLLLGLTSLYLTLGVVAFFRGFTLSLGPVTIGVTHAQKLWRIAAAAFALACVVQWLVRTSGAAAARRHPWPAAAAAFAAGYLPAIAHALAVGGSGPIAAMDAGGLTRALGPILTLVAPILAGYRAPSTAPLGVPAWTAAAPLVALAAGTLWLRARRDVTAFHAFLVTTPLLFLASGAFVDAQSYRYLVPLFSALPVVLAIGVDRLWRWSAAIGAGLAICLIAIGAWQQIAWHRMMAPDTETALIRRCLSDNAVRYAYAEYWLSYKLTFLTDERVIVAQTPKADQIVRYRPYQDVVAAHAPVPTLRHLPPGAAAPTCSDVVTLP